MKLNVTELRDGITGLHGIHAYHVPCVLKPSPEIKYDFMGPIYYQLGQNQEYLIK